MKYIIKKDNKKVIPRDENHKYFIPVDNKLIEYSSVDAFFVSQLANTSSITELNQLKAEYVVQETIPTCDAKYWQLNSDSTAFVEMQAEWKAYIDELSVWEVKRSNMSGKLLEITIKTDVNDALITGFDYFETTYPDLYKIAVAKTAVFIDIDEVTGECKAYMNTITPANMDRLLGDPRIEIYDLNKRKPVEPEV